MKKLVLTLIVLVALVSSLSAQIGKSKPAGNFSDSLNRIFNGFLHNYRNIQGKELVPQEEASVFQSLVGLPGSLHNIIYRSHSVKDTLASFQSVTYEGESYEAAVKNYLQLCGQVAKTKIQAAGSKSMNFKGKIEKPDESVRFTVTSLRLDATTPLLKKFLAEIELTNTYDGWEVHLNLHNREPEKEEVQPE